MIHFYRYDTETRYLRDGLSLGDAEKTVVTLRRYTMQNETPRGYWIIGGHWMKRRWISKTANKRYACPTKEQALESLLRRKQRQVEILERRLEEARKQLNAALEFAKQEKE